MRPHVELIQEDDYVWHPAELVGGEGRASERRLSVDEEDGSSSLRIDFHTDWGRAPGVHHANTEYYVLEGEMTIGDKTMGKGGYVHAQKGVPTEFMKFKEGTKILHYREYGDAGFDATDKPWEGTYEDVIVIDTEQMNYDPVANAGPMPGLFIKYLHVDPVSGFYTRLVFAKEGWSDHRLAHHPCYEEAYTLHGRMTYNFGDLDPGTYFFRPARVKHGHFVAEQGGVAWLLRSDGELTNWYTSNEWVRWGGDAVNYGKERRWSKSSHDFAPRPPTRTPEEINTLNASVAFQRSLGAKTDDYVAWGGNNDKSLEWYESMAHDLNGSHSHDHDHGHDHADDHSHDDNYLEDGPTAELKVHRDAPEPIISSYPVRSRSLGEWDFDGL